jgi:hypothetical protein
LNAALDGRKVHAFGRKVVENKYQVFFFWKWMLPVLFCIWNAMPWPSSGVIYVHWLIYLFCDLYVHWLIAIRNYETVFFLIC